MGELYSFGEWVRQRRRALDLTQDALAQRVGIAVSMVRKIEADERRPSRQVAGLLADALAVPEAERDQFLQIARAERSTDHLPTAVVGALDHGAAPAAQLLPSGTVTFLFTDIAGSTRLWEQHPAAMQRALARHDALMQAAVTGRNGVRVKRTGDGLHAAFARATDAVVAALDAQQALLDEPWEATGPLRVRMALHTGVAEERDGDYFGPALNRAARLLSIAHGGQVLLSRATYELVRDHLAPGVALQDLGVQRLKDLSQPEQVYQLTAPPLPTDFPPLARPIPNTSVKPPSPSSLPPLVGRQAEWRALQVAWRSTLQGRTQIGIIIGEAGIGKTRLAEELLNLAEQDGALTANAHTYAAAGQLAYAPLVAWLRAPALRTHLLQLPDADVAELSRLMPELLSERPGLAPPAPATESWQRLRMFEALARAVLTERRPLLLVLNDLQWCDQETLDWLHFVLRHDPTTPLLVLATVRAEDARADALRRWWQSLEREEHVTLLELGALDARATQALAEQVSAGVLSPEQMAKLCQQTEGNPLFVVELVRATLSAGLAEAAVEPHIPAQSTTALPARMQAVLQTRLAQLSPAASELISLAAVIGRAFTVAALTHAGEASERSVVAALDELWQRRIVREQPDGSFDFSHDKLREVAYAALSPARRRLLHRRVAEALEQIHAPALDEVSGQIAAHYAQAGLARQAALYYRQSAANAHQVGALQEAAEQLEHGLRLVRQLPTSAVDLQLELELQADHAMILMLLKGFALPETVQAYERAFELAQRVDKVPQLFPILWGLHEVYLFQAKGAQARAMAEQCMVLAQQLADPGLILQAHHALWPILGTFFPDELAQAMVHIEAGIALYDPERHQNHRLQYGGHDPYVCGNMIAAKFLWLLGYPQQALQRGQAAIHHATKIKHPFSLAVALNNTGMMETYRREPRMVRELASQSRMICEQQHFPMILAETQILYGWARAMEGEIATGIGELREGMEGWNALGTMKGQPYHQLLLADAYLAEGDPLKALVAANHAIAAASIEGYLEAETHRMRGAALLAIGAPSEQVEESFQQALTVSRRQGTRSLELRSSVSLARLWQGQGRHTDAHWLLSAIYGWFTEGFDTADLIEAKSLLDELSSHLH